MGCDGHGDLSDSELSKPLPWIGLYVAAASLICGLSMFADLLRGFRNRKFWFPCNSFSLNATSLTFIAVSVKLSVDLNTSMPSRQDQLAKLSSNVFVCTLMANSMPSLGFMLPQDLLMNLMALAILVFTDLANICIQLGTGAIYVFTQEHVFVIVLTLLMFVTLTFSAITVPTTKRFLELRYKNKYELALEQCPSTYAERRGGLSELKEDLIKFWMMAHTSSPQFVMARSVTCTTSGFLCFLTAFTLVEAMLRSYFLHPKSLGFCNGVSDYKWSTTLVLVFQSAAVVIGTVALASRWFSAVRLRCPSGANKSLRDELRVESYWVECLSVKKERPLNIWMFHGRLSRKLAHDLNRCILDLCIATQYVIVLASKFLRFVAVYFVSWILLCCCCFNLTRTNAESSGSSVLLTRQFVLYLEGEEELVDYMARSNREATNHLIQKGRKKQPLNLIELLEATNPISKGFQGIRDFDSDEVASLTSSGEPPNSWALPLVTLTSIAVSLPNVKACSVNKLVKAVNEALVYINKFRDVLDTGGELANSRKSAEVVWLGVDLYHKWLNVDLRKLSRQQERTKPQEVFKDLVDIAKKEFSETWEKNMMKQKPSRWPIKTLAANSMYRISQTLWNKYESKEITEREEECSLLKEVERMVSDIIAGCFCNAARVVAMKCLVTAVEVREASVREAAMHLGRTEKLLEIVDKRNMPEMSHEKVAKIDEWREFYRKKKRIPCTIHPSTQCTTCQITVTIE